MVSSEPVLKATPDAQAGSLSEIEKRSMLPILTGSSLDNLSAAELARRLQLQEEAVGEDTDKSGPRLTSKTPFILKTSAATMNGFSIGNSTDSKSTPLLPKSQQDSDVVALPAIDPKDLLERITYKANKNGSVDYFLDKAHIFSDHGQHLHMTQGGANQNEAILAAILVAKEKFGGAFELTGSEAFKRAALELLVKHNVHVKLKHPEQEALRLEMLGKIVKNDVKQPSSAVDGIIGTPVKPKEAMSAKTEQNTPATTNASPVIKGHIPAHGNVPATQIALFKSDTPDKLHGYIKTGEQQSPRPIVAQIIPRPPGSAASNNFIRLMEQASPNEWKDIGYGNAVNKLTNGQTVTYDQYLLKVGSQTIPAKVSKDIEPALHKALGFNESMQPKIPTTEHSPEQTKKKRSSQDDAATLSPPPDASVHSPSTRV